MDKNLVDTLKELGAFIILIGGLFGTIAAGVVTIIKAKADAKEQAVKADVEKSKIKLTDAELAERLNALQEKIIGSLEERFERLEEELSKTKENYAAEQRRTQTLRAAGLKLIEAIEAGFNARESAEHSQSCTACLAQDRALMRHLRDVKKLFEQE